MAWWAIGGAGFLGGWAAGAYLIAAAREREFVYRLAQRFLIGLVFVVATVGGLLSRSGNLGGTVDVIAGVTALGLGLICAFCGARTCLSQRRAGLAIRAQDLAHRLPAARIGDVVAGLAVDAGDQGVFAVGAAIGLRGFQSPPVRLRATRE